MKLRQKKNVKYFEDPPSKKTDKIKNNKKVRKIRKIRKNNVNKNDFIINENEEIISNKMNKNKIVTKNELLKRFKSMKFPPKFSENPDVKPLINKIKKYNSLLSIFSELLQSEKKSIKRKHCAGRSYNKK